MNDTTLRVLVVASAALVLVGVGLAVGSGTPADAAPGPTTDAASVPQSAASPPVDARQGDASERPLLDCTDGTSPGVVACGYNSGPIAVDIEDQLTTGDSVTVSGVELDEGGFVAVHAVSYVDGQFTESVRGVSAYLEPGLHRDVAVELDRPVTDGTTLVAVVYRDSDDDGEFEFVDTDGAVDRPYTNTYSAETGNVTSEAGDVVGDSAQFSPTNVRVRTVRTPAEGGATVTVRITNDNDEPIDLSVRPRTLPSGVSVAAVDSEGGVLPGARDAVVWSQVPPGRTVTATYRLDLSGDADGSAGTANFRVGLGDGTGTVPTTVTLPERGVSQSVVALAGEDRRFAFEEVVRAVELYNSDEPVPETGDTLSFDDVVDIVRLFNADRPV
ncbi:hypothetical protein BRD10_04200 [Halobacteriales archaeon SW_12_71_31]|nr:MAG: hypothetical protein BRD10_04200 [Halobacteriales archaeon SW_12_71_31]